MKNNRFAHILSIMVLALIFAFTMAVSVMADDTDSENTSADKVAAEEIADEDAEEVAEDIDDAEEEVIDNNDTAGEEVTVVDDTEEVKVDDSEVIDDVAINASDSDDSDIVDTNNTEVADDEEIIEEVVVVEPTDSENEDQGELGDTSWAEPAEGGMMYYVQHPDGSVESWFEADDDEELGVVGDASSYDPTTGETTVFKADGSVKVYADNKDNEYSYQTAAAVYSDTFAPLPVLSEEKTETVETVVAPAVEAEESAVLGDYEEAESEENPFKSGIAFFTSTLIGLGVLWKIGLFAL